MLNKRQGFTLIELMVGLAILSLLLAAAAPAVTTWIANAKVRTVSDSLQVGLRVAQAEAARRYRQTVFFRTASGACDNTATASATGNFWAVKTIALLPGDEVEVVQCGALLETGNNITVTGPVPVCFSTAGRYSAVADPGIGGSTACTVDASGSAVFDISGTGSNRALSVRVSLAGSVRLCDKAKTFSASTPDGCPT
jgi:type IV fimbrial biogenesis protein FimT